MRSIPGSAGRDQVLGFGGVGTTSPPGKPGVGGMTGFGVGGGVTESIGMVGLTVDGVVLGAGVAGTGGAASVGVPPRPAPW
jgi:hypothetical protein